MANDSAATNVVPMRPPRNRPVQAVKPDPPRPELRAAAHRGLAKARTALAKARVKAVPDGE